MIPLNIGVADPPTPNRIMTMRQLDRLLLIHGQEGRAGDATASRNAPARRVTMCACAHCTAPFPAKTRRARWCSDACKQAAYRARKAEQRRALMTCDGCHERFRPVNGNQRFCCSNCKSRTWKRQRRDAARFAAAIYAA